VINWSNGKGKVMGISSKFGCLHFTWIPPPFASLLEEISVFKQGGPHEKDKNQFFHGKSTKALVEKQKKVVEL